MPIEPLRCGFLLFDGFSNMVLASAIEPLRAARDYAGAGTFVWRLATMDGGAVTSSSGLVLQPDGPLDRMEPVDVLFVVAGYGAREHARPGVIAALQRMERRVGRLGALDCGAWILAAGGLLDGHRATIHWQELDAFAETFLTVEAVGDRFVVDRRRISAGGATTVIDLMLRMIGERGGNALAYDVSNMFIYDVERALGRGRGAQSRSVEARAPQLIRAIAEMRRTQEQPLSLERIAAAAAVSPRTLARLFERELGMSPGRYYQSIRLASARSLAEETNLTTSEIAARTGFASASALSRALTAHFGQSVRSFRAGRLRKSWG